MNPAGALGLGLDGGGSGTRWALHGAAGPVASGQLGAVSGHLFNAVERDRLDAMCTGLASAITAYGGRVAALVAGITGLSATAPEARVAAASLAGAAALDPRAVHVEDDIWIAYHGAFAPGEGHVVYAGTGSIGVHIRADGTVLRVGGRGMLIDDAGSAFAIGRAALSRIFRAQDADPSATGALARAVFAAIGGADWDRVRAYVYGGGRDAVAQLARAVAAAASEGDADATALLDDAGVELARLARVLAGREGARPVALLGRAAALHPSILDAMRRAVPSLEVSQRSIDAAATAARLAYGRAVDARAP